MKRHLPKLTVANFLRDLAPLIREKKGREIDRAELRRLARRANSLRVILYEDDEQRMFQILNEFNVIIGGFGVRFVVDGGSDGRVVEADVNTGDTYSPTVLWCGLNETFHVTTFGDWHEIRADRKGRAFTERLTTGSI